ncbi:hypothetical protein BDY17DRAFT_296118 [Neohortaea acidophila]|uniref:Uncharacterized protein n=1 Tax=Neohortaea acidophila TaxID=245834 RepID=A0A6A6PXD4_9PEZI|nr:uncharacterized protein BDY17DRAFT_296118 [Neohortaea acidophila]KAF2484675.1 hypothetical protein BDY17DRAFT_296118 [Neohortaea acidophila]
MAATTPTTYDFKVAKASLSENDKDRFLAVYLNLIDPNTAVNWKKAADDFGSASVESFKKTVSNALKKIKAAEAKGITGDAGVTPSPAGGKNKRKAKGAAVASDADDDDETAPTPAKKKRGRPAKKAAKAAEGEFFPLMFGA